MYETNKVSALLNKCVNNHADFKSEILMCQTLHNMFYAVVTYLNTEVGRIFPDMRATGGRKSTISELSSKVKGKGK